MTAHNAFHLVPRLAAIHTNDSHVSEETRKEESITIAQEWGGRGGKKKD
jgi:hypothetical protein